MKKNDKPSEANSSPNAHRSRSIPVVLLLLLVVLLSAGSGIYAGATFVAQQAPNVTVTTTIFTTTTSWTTSTIWSTVTEVVQGVLTTIEYTTSTSTVTVTGSTSYRPAKSVTANGNARISTAQSKFGGASGSFGGAGYVSLADSADWAFGSGDFTIDFWIRRGDTARTQIVTGQGTGSNNWYSNWWIQILSDGRINCQAFYGGSTVYVISTGRITDTTTWHHIAFARSGSTLLLFIDGIQNGTVNIGANALNHNPTVLAVGRLGSLGSLYFNGLIDEYRISKGVARWTSNFTPPTNAYCGDSNTVLLLHMDGADGSTGFIDDPTTC